MTAMAVVDPRDYAGDENKSATTPTSAPAGFVAVPHGLIVSSKLSDQAVLLWCLLAGTPARDDGWRRVSHANLAARAGWAVSDDAGSKRLQRAGHELVDAGWLRIRQCRISPTVAAPVYLIAGSDRRATSGLFEQLPRWVLARLTGPTAKGEAATLVRHWLAWRLEAGARGWTDSSIARMARNMGVKPAKVSSVLRRLEDLGVVRVNRTPGASATITPAALALAEGPDHTQSESVISASARSSDASAAVVDQALGCGKPGEGAVGPLPDLSGRSYPICPPTPARSVRSSLDTLLDEPLDLVACPADSLTNRASADLTADKPPTQDHPAATPAGSSSSPRRDLDPAAHSAARIVSGLRLLAGQPKLRGQARQRIAAQLRRHPDVDPRELGRVIAEEFEGEAAGDGIGDQHCALIDRAVGRIRSDLLAAPTPPPVPKPPPLGERDQGIPLRTPRPQIPTLEDLAARPATAPRSATDDATDWAIVTIAGRILGEENPARALRIVSSYLQVEMPAHRPDIAWAERVISRSLDARAVGQNRAGHVG